jgi:uncharacterized protein
LVIESHRSAPAHYVPAYLQRVGYEVVPVPVYYPDVRRDPGRTRVPELEAVPGEVDLVVVFRRSADVDGHIDDILAKRPRAVWFQLGIRNDDAARRLAAAGIDVVQDRCTMIEHPDRDEGNGQGGCKVPQKLHSRRSHYLPLLPAGP